MKPSETCSGNGMVDLDSKEECTDALHTLQDELPDTSQVKDLTNHLPDRPAKCFYSTNQEIVYWNTHSHGSPCTTCRSICKGNGISIFVL